MVSLNLEQGIWNNVFVGDRLFYVWVDRKALAIINCHWLRTQTTK